MSSLDIKAFLTSIHPFDELQGYSMEKLSNAFDVTYLKKGERFLKQGDKAEFFYIVAKGVIKESGDAEFYLGERDFFDFEALLAGEYKSSFEAVEETILYFIAKDEFLSTVHSNTKIENYFFLSAAKKLEEKHKTSDSYLIKKITDIQYETPIFVNADNTIYDAVLLMTEHKKTFCLIRFEDETGIITDSDLRKKVLLKRMDLDSKVGEVATRNICIISKNDFLFNALLVMTKHNIKRVALTDENGICGVLQDIDILSAFSTQTQFVARKIELARDKDELKTVMADIDSAVKNLLDEGVKVKHIVKLVGELNLKVFQKVFEWSFDDSVRGDIALVVFGSEGRGEQILRTDQDNALLLRNDQNPDDFASGAKMFNDTLIELGYPECDGGIMTVNGYYRKKVEEYKKDVYNMIFSPTLDSFLNLPILMDMRFVVGDEKLPLELKEYMTSKLLERPEIIARMAGGSMAFETPLSILGGFVLDKKEHSGELDIKKGGIFPIVNSIRCLAFEKKIQAVSTFERVKELNNIGMIDRAFAEEIIEAYNFLLEIRLKERLYKINIGQKPDNYINPSRLSKLERDLLRDVLKITDKLKKFVFNHFKLGYLS